MSKPIHRVRVARGETVQQLLKLPVCAAVTLLLLILTWITRPLDVRGTWLQAFTVFWARTILRICQIRVNLAGLQRVDPSRQYVFVCNHSSWIDIPVILATLPFPIIFMAKRELFHMPLVGACLRRTGQIAIDRTNPRRFAEGFKKAAEALRHNGRSILFFPAGTRASSGSGQFKDGAAYFAIKAGLPIVPFALIGTDVAMPRGSIRILGGSIQVIVGTPVETTNLSLAARTNLTKQLEGEVLSLMTYTSQEISPGDGCIGKPLGVSY